MSDILSLIGDELKRRGWTVEVVAGGVRYIDPDGNAYGSIGDAVMAESLREIGGLPDVT